MTSQHTQNEIFSITWINIFRKTKWGLSHVLDTSVWLFDSIGGVTTGGSTVPAR